MGSPENGCKMRKPLGKITSIGMRKLVKNEKLTTIVFRRKKEEHINTFPQYAVPVKAEGQESTKLHFVALFSEKKDAVPLLLLHGWPGTNPPQMSLNLC
jgi:hypothetical protein